MTDIKIKVVGVDGQVNADSSKAVVVADQKGAKSWTKAGTNQGVVKNMKPGPGGIFYRVVGEIGVSYQIQLQGAVTATGKRIIIGRIPKSTKIADNLGVDINARKLVIQP